MPASPSAWRSTTTPPGRAATICAAGSHLWTVAAFSFYRGGTLVPFVANALDPVNGSNLTLWYLDYFVTNNLIVDAAAEVLCQVRRQPSRPTTRGARPVVTSGATKRV